MCIILVSKKIKNVMVNFLVELESKQKKGSHANLRSFEPVGSWAKHSCVVITLDHIMCCVYPVVRCLMFSERTPTQRECRPLLQTVRDCL